MPNWSEIKTEINNTLNPLDAIRWKYLKRLADYRKRNVITYYSAFLTKAEFNTEIMDSDKSMFMNAVHKLDKSKGLDLILNTEGGSIAATESIVDYLWKIFKQDICIFVPQIAMSAGTMIACSGKEIHMGLQSNLGPIDPQLRGISAQLVLKEYEEARDNLLSTQPNVQYYNILLSKYPPTIVQLCRNACQWSEQLVAKWLSENMFKDENNGEKKEKIDLIVRSLSDTDQNYSHGRHIHLEQLEQVGLKIVRLESDNKLQDLVLTVHHAYMHTFVNTNAIKIVENHKGNATILAVGN